MKSNLRNALVLLVVAALMAAAGGCGGSGGGGGSGELTVAPSSLALNVGGIGTLTAENYEGELTWKSLDESVAAVTGDGAAGTVTAIGEGRTSIVVTDGSGATAECAVAVASGFSIPPTNGNWADVADTSWYRGYRGGANYEISTAEQLAGFAKLFSEGETIFDTITLTSDVNLSGREWTPILGFFGTFNGNGHIISGLTITRGGPGHLGLGLFRANFGTLKNINLEDVYISSSESYTGGLVGWNDRGGTIESCTISGNVSSTDTNTGGLVGRNEGTIESCTTSANAVGTSNVGGFAGMNYGTIESCTTSANAVGTSNVGGFAGMNYGTIKSCTASGSVAGGDRGGFVCVNMYGTLVNNRNNTGITPAIGRDTRKSPPGPSDDI
jgi:hypothetical protein